MRIKTIVITVFIFLVIVNLPVINTEILKRVDGDHFRYSNANGSYTTIQFFDILQPWMSEWAIKGFISDQHPSIENKEMFRIYRINPLCFWRWRYYWVVSQKFEYRNWDEIDPNRVPRAPGNMWQQF